MSEVLIGIIVNAAIALAAIGTLIYQIIFNNKSLDYNLHPVFKITEFCPKCTKFWTPKLCTASVPESKHFDYRKSQNPVIKSIFYAFNLKKCNSITLKKLAK